MNWSKAQELNCIHPGQRIWLECRTCKLVVIAATELRSNWSKKRTESESEGQEHFWGEEGMKTSKADLRQPQRYSLYAQNASDNDQMSKKHR
jgi:hypothetical protein